MKGGEGTFYNPNAVKTFFNILSSILSVLVSKKDESSFRGALESSFPIPSYP